jgi:hypothetical protein
MLRQLLVGAAVSISNIAIHALVMMVVVNVAVALSNRRFRRHALMLPTIMIGAAMVLKAAHTCEVALWALTYWIVGAAPQGTDLFYFAFVNYTTLGYGDIVPLPEWRLLGPITAATGILMFGWSTAVMFEVLRRAMPPGSRGNH